VLNTHLKTTDLFERFGITAEDLLIKAKAVDPKDKDFVPTKIGDANEFKLKVPIGKTAENYLDAVLASVTSTTSISDKISLLAPLQLAFEKPSINEKSLKPTTMGSLTIVR